jgi:hypothetical protein
MIAVVYSLISYTVEHHNFGKGVRKEHSELYTVAGCSHELKANIRPRLTEN